MRKRVWTALLMAVLMVLLPCTVPAANLTEPASSVMRGTVSGNRAAAVEADAAWTASDFTYGDYEKELYGCDYTREFTVSGKVVTGFSDTGIEKWETNKDLVLPPRDTEGNRLVGVGGHAFENRGLTSVTFPTGMMIPYNDPIADRYPITKRGNYIIAESAFAKNALTEVYLPSGVIAVLPNAFQNNQITKVTIPRTIWWIETLAFANNQITNVSFPDTTDFMFEMHGMAFADNQIRSVVIPDYTEVINKHVFVLNPGMEECPAEAGDKEAGLGGVVYMYTDNLNLKYKDRIHHIERPTASQKSWHQKLIVLGGSNTLDGEAAASTWTINDFTIDGTVITGLSESGIAKRAVLKDLILPNINKTGDPITEIADSANSAGGLFATADEKFDSVRLPSSLLKIGQNAFAEARLKDVVFPAELAEIGQAAFRDNDLRSVVLPNTVTVLGAGAFATNPNLEYISLSTGVTEIPDSAFGCSDAKHWMTNLRQIEIPPTVTKIGKRAFAGNNFERIEIPDSVRVIDEYAFSTKNYLRDPCTVELSEGLTTIGNRAFRNKIIAEIRIPSTVTSIPAKTFEKEYSDGFEPGITKVYISSLAQYEDKVNFASTEYHEIIYEGADKWTAEDFTYDTYTLTTSDMVQIGNDTSTALTGDIYVVTGLSDSGKTKIVKNQDLVIPAEDPAGRKIQGIGKSAFKAAAEDIKIQSLILPETENAANTGLDPAVSKRGDFFILDGAFSGNEITDLTIPEGTLFIARQAFINNRLTNLTLPESLMVISQQAFAGKEDGTSNSLVSVGFPEKTDFPLFIGAQSFAFNKIQAVQLPAKTAAVNRYAFFVNPGKEPVTEGNANEKKGGIVYMYIEDEAPSSAIAHLDNPGTGNFGKSNIQKLISGAVPSEDTPWNAADFTYSADGTAIVGLSESGQKKIQANPNLVLPDQGPDGTAVTEIGSGPDNSTGTFTFTDTEGTVYTPVSVKFPSGLKKIGNYAFVAQFDMATGEQTGLTSVRFPDTLEEIGMMAFRYAPLSSVELPDSVTALGAGVFATSEKAKTLMTEAKLSASLTAVPMNLFASQTLTSIEIPEGVTSIGNHAFNGSPITSLTLPSTLTSIGNYAFQNHQITELEIPASVKTIGTYAFKNFQESRPKTLTGLTLHEGLTSIGKEAFYGSKLKTVEIPESLTTLHVDAFKENESGEAENKVILKTKNADQAAAEGSYTKVVTEGSGHIVQLADKMYGTGWNEYDFTYSEDGTVITGFSGSGNAKRLLNHDVVLPDRSPAGADITAIADQAFALAEAEVSINKYECVSPDGIQTVVLPANLETIGVKAFEYNNLQEITFTDGLTGIGESAFHGNHLKSVHLPNTVTDLGNGAFAMNDITDLVLSDGVTAIPQGAFAMNIRLERITIPETVTEIGEMAFAGARLTSLTIPASVAKVGRKAFHLHRLKELTVPGTLKEIGDNAFEGTYKGTTLKSLTLEEGIESIGSGAFKEGLLEEVDLPASLVTMGSEPFENNTGENGEGVVLLHSENAAHLKFNKGARTHRVVVSEDLYWNANDFIIENGVVTGLSDSGRAKVTVNPNMVLPEADNAGNPVTGIAQQAFADLTDIVTVVIPDSITEMGEAAFRGAAALEDVTLSKNLPLIPKDAFLNHQLKSLEIPESVKTIEQGAFRAEDGTLGKTLTSLTLHEGLTAIGQYAFGGSSLTDVELPGSVETLHREAFLGSTGMVNVRTDNAALLTADNPSDMLNIVLRPRTVTFDAVVEAMDPASAETGAKGTLDTLPGIIFDDVAFLGWYTEKDGGEPVSADRIYEESTTIYAHWKSAEAEDASAAINALPDPVEPGDIAAVEAAKAAYDALTDHQKALVDETAAAKLAGAVAQAEKLKADQEAADAAAALINAIPDPVGLADEETVRAARAAFDALTEEQKLLLQDAETLEKKLTDAESRISAAKVEDAIEKLPDEIHAEDEEAVAAARSAYDALTEEEKALVNAASLEKLEAAEAKLKDISDQAAADAAAAAIAAIPEDVGIDSGDLVAKAREAYDALTDAQKAKVEPEAVNRLREAGKAVAKARIEALPENAGAADEAAVEAAQKAYDALTDEQKAELGDELKDRLETAKKQVADAKAAAAADADDGKAAAAVADKINALPAADKLTLADQSAVDEAAKAYDALTDAQKQKVPEDAKKKLEDAKSALAALEKEEQAEEAAGNMTLDAFDRQITSASKEDPAGTEFGKLQLKAAKKVGKDSIKVQWKKAAGASGYVIYANKAGKKNKYVKIAEVKGKTSFTLKKIKGKKLKKNTYYKVLVAAVKTTKGGTARVIAKAKPVYAATNGGKNGNPLKLTVNKSAVKMKAKKTFRLKVKQAKPKGKKIVKKKAVSYESSDKSIATVSKKGVIKGVKAGKCKIYVYAQNGLMKTVKVTVKK